VLWQHVFQVVVCVLSVVHAARHSVHTPQYVEANIRYFNVNFNILYV